MGARQDGSAPSPTRTRWAAVLAASVAALAFVPPVIVLAKSAVGVPGDAIVPIIGKNTTCGRATREANVLVGRGPIAFAQLPGDVLSATRRVTVDDPSADPDTGAPGRGAVWFVTIHLSSVRTWLAMDLAKRDCRAELLNRDQVLGGATTSAEATQSRSLMQASQQLSEFVALRRLGRVVAVRDGGVVIDSLCLEGPEGACLRQAPAASVLAKGDVITSVDGHQVDLDIDIATALQGHRVGDIVSVVYEHRNVQANALVELTTAPGSDVPILGVTPSAMLPSSIQFDFPIDVRIDSGAVGGPSAGLAFTLALLDALSPGSLTGGLRVAATGAIQPSGRVAEVGGVRQKTIAVRDAGAQLFLVPAAQEAVARAAAAGSALVVQGVRTLDDALDVLTRYGGAGVAAPNG